MKLNDINGTAINTDKVALINPSAMDLDKHRLTLVIDNIKYAFSYLKVEDMQTDYEKIYTIVEGK